MGTDWAEYAHKRRDWFYIAEVRREIIRHSPGTTIIDVGSGGINLAATGSFTNRFAVDLWEPAPIKGVKMITGDWATVQLPVESADVITCCQVLEHLQDAEIAPFVDRLRSMAKVLIVSVPFKWKAGQCKGHYQDPIDQTKLQRMVGLAPVRSTIILDGGISRLVAVYDIAV